MLSNCPRCKTVFNSSIYTICDNCRKEEENEVVKVREYIIENPGITLSNLSIETDISVKRIIKYIREGKIELSSPEIECERCKTKIRLGRYCADCSKKMHKEIIRMRVSSKKEDNVIENKTKNIGMYSNRK
ncbi:MAG: hypothetical protein FWF57_08365 [Defluviitaleaceae bacterium]|nr:hypothetical protein [Defluviitaleaceae bacterium]